MKQQKQETEQERKERLRREDGLLTQEEYSKLKISAISRRLSDASLKALTLDTEAVMERLADLEEQLRSLTPSK